LEHQKKRIVWIDVCRSLAIILVVLCHSSEHYYRPVFTGVADASWGDWFFENTTFILGRIGVPFFLMISGYLLLSKAYQSPARFYKKNLIPLLITTLIWLAISYAFMCIQEGSAFNIQTFLYELFMVKESSLSSMWYMPVILGIYLIIPFLSYIANGGYLEPEKSAIPLTAALILLFLLPTFNFIASANIKSYQELIPQTDVTALGGYYVVYVVLGFMIVRYKIFKKLKLWEILLIGLLGFSGMTWMVQNRLDLEIYDMRGVIWYNSIFIAIMSVAGFELCRRLKDKTTVFIAKWSEKISKLSLGIFFVHLMLLKTFVKYVNLDFLPVFIRIILVFLVTFVLSFLLTYLLCKNRRVGRILCYYKG